MFRNAPATTASVRFAHLLWWFINVIGAIHRISSTATTPARSRIVNVDVICIFTVRIGGLVAPPPPSQQVGVKPPKLERAPKNPMKKFNWIKLPDRELNQNPHAVWMKMQGAKSTLKVNYDSIEEQFSQKQAEPKTENPGKPTKVFPLISIVFDTKYRFVATGRVAVG